MNKTSKESLAVKAALAGIKSAWKNMLAAEDRETYNFWSEERLRLQKVLYEEATKVRGKLYRREKPKDSERIWAQKKYQHEYYLRVTRRKRAERRKNEQTNS